jgi:tellurite methyltransferase
MYTSMNVCLLFLSIFVFSPLANAGTGYTYFQTLTGDNADSDKARWDVVYGKNKGYVFGKDPAAFLSENLNLLPVGRTLDLAMGEGRNAVFLAKKGFDVLGVDISDVAIRKAKRLAHDNGVRIRTLVTDLNHYQIPPDSYDLILVFYYLQRSLIPQIVRGLKPGGVLVFENYTTGEMKYDKGQRRVDLLEKDELKTLFKDLVTEKYQEVDNATEAYASLLARKPKPKTH